VSTDPQHDSVLPVRGEVFAVTSLTFRNTY
jgi:hypothetical protein